MAGKKIEKNKELGKNKDNKKQKKSKKGMIFLLIIFIILILSILSFIALIKFNIFGISDKFRAPLENIPIIKNLLPESDEEVNLENIDENDLSIFDMGLEQSNSNYNETIDSLNKQIEDLNKEVLRLREIEEQQLQFKKDKEEFDKMIALNDTNAYAKFYESISPENAEQLYKEAIVTNETSKEFKDYAQTFENMKKDSAASVLEEIMTSDIDLVINILKNLSSSKRAEILSAMSSQNAAICIKKMTA